MKWSFRIARIAGIGVDVHVTFFLLLVWVGWMEWQRSGDLGLVGMGVLFTLVTFLIIVMHEFGHALSARWFGIRTRDITLLPFGGLARLERMPDKPWQEIVVALAGPAVNVALVIAFGAWILLTDGRRGLVPRDLLHGPFAVRLMWLNLILTVFNLIPAFPMDGGRVLRAALATSMDHASATRWAATIGRGFAALFVVLGLAVNPGLALVGLFVWFGAGAESQSAQFRAGLQGLRVGHALQSSVQALDGRGNAADAAARILAAPQRDWPVLVDGRFLGLVGSTELCDAVARLGPAVTVEAATDREAAIVRMEDSLEEAVPRIQGSRHRSAAVVDAEGRLLGLVSLDAVSQLLLLRAAWASAQSGRAR